MVSPILRYLFALLEPAPARAFFRFLAPAYRERGVVDSQVKNDVADRTRTADEQIAGRWHIERLRLVVDLSRDETAFTIVADPGPACPAYRDVARLGEFQHALIDCRIPVGGYAAARERDERAGFEVERRPMRSPCHTACDPRRR